MSGVEIYMEGGGDSRDGKAALRQGMDALLEPLKAAARSNALHWKLRGKEPIKEEKLFPWFWIDSKLTGERVDDRHFSLALKQAGRKANGTQDDDDAFTGL